MGREAKLRIGNFKSFKRPLNLKQLKLRGLFACKKFKTGGDLNLLNRKGRDAVWTRRSGSKRVRAPDKVGGHGRDVRDALMCPMLLAFRARRVRERQRKAVDFLIERAGGDLWVWDEKNLDKQTDVV